MLILSIVIPVVVVLLLGLLLIYLYRPIYRPSFLGDLYDHHIVVTGGSSGIGKELARKLLNDYGARVTILARNRDRLDQCYRELTNGQSDRLLCLSVDISKNYDEVQQTIEQAIRHHHNRPVTVLINNAGTFYARTFQETKPNEFDEMMRINYLGSVYCTQACLATNQRQTLKRIVFVSSQAGQLGVYGYTSYCSTKFALRGLAESLQMELIRENIFITLVFPPDTDTPGLTEENKSKPEETRLINQTSGVVSSEHVATKIIEQMQRGSFTCSYGLNGKMLTCVTAGAQPVTTIKEIIAQSLFMSLLRLIMLRVLTSFYKIVRKPRRSE